MSACESELQFHAWEKRNRPKMGEESKPITHTHTHTLPVIARKSYKRTSLSLVERRHKDGQNAERERKKKGKTCGGKKGTRAASHRPPVELKGTRLTQVGGSKKNRPASHRGGFMNIPPHIGHISRSL